MSADFGNLEKYLESAVKIARLEKQLSKARKSIEVLDKMMRDRDVHKDFPALSDQIYFMLKAFDKPKPDKLVSRCV